jgi:rhodanese-related sulfurtransferase
MAKKQPLQAAALIIAAVVLALVTNAFAARQRKLVLPGFYPNATKVPVRTAEPPAITQQAPVAEPSAPSTQQPVLSTQQPALSTQEQTRSTSPKKTEPAPKAKPDISRFQPHPDKPYVEINGDDVAALYTGGALFLDARRTSVYEEGHIAGARPFSVWESDVDDKVNALFNERSDPSDQNRPIVIYCSGGACEDSHMLAQKLWGIQFNNVYVYKDGFPDWEKRGGAVRKGATP